MSKITVCGLGGNSIFMSVDHFHRRGETLSATALYTEPGGKGYNQAVAAARLGANVSFIGAFGKDSTSTECINYLKNEGITPLVAYKAIPCACACILTDNEGENRVTVYGGAASLLNSDDIKAAEKELSDTEILILQNEVSPDANRALVDLAERYGITVIFNPAPAVGFDKGLLKPSHIITPNEHEAKLLFGEDYRAGIEAFGFKKTVVTLGDKGADCFCDGAWTRLPAVKTKTVDTTGAGDCFNGALAAGLSRGYSFMDACNFAIRAASIAVSRKHAVAAMPKMGEVL